MYLSVIIPAYNEAKRIGPTLDKIHAFFKKKDYDYEVIIVDDGSTDQTMEIASLSLLAKSNKLKIIKNGVNKGKGFSVKQGILNSKGEFVLFTDSDLSTPIEEADKLMAVIQKGHDMVLGSRSTAGSDVRVHQPWHRERMGKVFNFLVKLLLVKDFNDTQCGFKLVKGDRGREVAKELKIEGFCFDVEMVYLFKKKGFSITEVGVIWENSAQSKVKVLGSSMSMFSDLFKIKKLHKCCD